MPTYVYLGFSKEQKKARFEARKAGLKVPCQSMHDKMSYVIDSKDHEQVRQMKQKNIKDWLAEREKEIKAEIEAMDKIIVLGSANMEFAQGQPVTVERKPGVSAMAIEQNDLLEKLDTMVANGVMQKVDGRSVKPEKPKKSDDITDPGLKAEKK